MSMQAIRICVMYGEPFNGKPNRRHLVPQWTRFLKPVHTVESGCLVCFVK